MDLRMNLCVIIAVVVTLVATGLLQATGLGSTPAWTVSIALGVILIILLRKYFIPDKF